MLLRSVSPAALARLGPSEMSSTATGQISRNTAVRADSQNKELRKFF